ncbi:MerR family transcriptional regulator [Paenibacillus pinisoli]|uniref:MerR family transcriptional regulator n=1 Tax=Paenibacillus pinisoli TaxID=1276110 RepID=A0A3A6PS08_9BACL|nr:MerR family transcriptional regulator [Paenibacillus pinisoli]RJX39421.1 MerR family transcriptional regulator [Paenibacillus pinisoli]
MKMKEVCKHTGLTERTIRYYVEEGLVSPEVSVRNGREYREYSAKDVEELNTIAGLRKLFFTIDEIKDMQLQPERIGEILSAYKLKLANDAKAKAAIVEALNGIAPGELRDVASIASKLKDMSEKLPLPQRDINPNFGKFETGTKAEREQEYSRFVERQAKQFKRGKVIVYTIAILNIAMALFSFILSFNILTLIVQVVLAVCLIVGVTWVRYLFAVGAAMAVFLSVQLLVMSVSEGLIGFIIYTLCLIVYSGISSFLLFKSEAVSEFLYAQKNG